MKRLAILGMILACFATPGLGQRRTRSISQKVIQLTDPNLTGTMSLEEALVRRRSVREFSTEPLRRSQIGQLAWAGQGVTDPGRGLRTAPSAESLYPMELFIATDEGLFTYNPAEHSLHQTMEEDVRSELARATLTPEPVAAAACSIIVAGSSRKISNRLGARSLWPWKPGTSRRISSCRPSAWGWDLFLSVAWMRRLFERSAGCPENLTRFM